MFRARSIGLIMASLLSGFAQAEILEERLASGSSIFVPSAFPINPAANATNQTIVAVQQAKRDEHVTFAINPDQTPTQVDEKIAKKDLAIGGQYPLGELLWASNTQNLVETLVQKTKTRIGKTTNSLFIATIA